MNFTAISFHISNILTIFEHRPRFQCLQLAMHVLAVVAASARQSACLPRNVSNTSDYVVTLCLEVELHVEIHTGWSHESRVFSEVQSEWRVAR